MMVCTSCCLHQGSKGCRSDVVGSDRMRMAASVPIGEERQYNFLGSEYCAGYRDAFGGWTEGFYCPKPESQHEVYCCGAPSYKYCCARRDQHLLEETDMWRVVVTLASRKRVGGRVYRLESSSMTSGMANMYSGSAGPGTPVTATGHVPTSLIPIPIPIPASSGTASTLPRQAPLNRTFRPSDSSTLRRDRSRSRDDEEPEKERKKDKADAEGDEGEDDDEEEEEEERPLVEPPAPFNNPRITPIQTTVPSSTDTSTTMSSFSSATIGRPRSFAGHLHPNPHHHHYQQHHHHEYRHLSGTATLGPGRRSHSSTSTHVLPPEDALYRSTKF
ncbi:unnamed protein product [Darwinula stevensoni]|uniref:Shisa N-terminal domain-containing protein n=1 Tax=Darwinula stevensoni TaxID=69355 RepID=A0A7R9A3D5_9CRUS|nr:unnamed protein product [Darwinula stevensoni]CAG0881880.1 unnamed protein product [Darwinula stevensoni]